MRNLELRGLIHGKFQSESACADKLGWSKQKLNRISTGKQMPDVEEVWELANVLETPLEKMFLIFLPEKSTNGPLQ